MPLRAVARLVAWALTLVIVLTVLVVGAAYWRFTSEIGADVDRLVASAQPVAHGAITEAQIAALPPPAQRYFRAAGVVGKAIPRVVRLEQKGRIRGSTTADWMNFTADETYSTNPPAFVWRAWFPTAAMPVALGRDEYLEGNGSILIKMLAVAPLADEHGDELRAAGLMRYLNEMMWFPAAMLGPNMTITAVDDASFRLAITDRDMTAEAVLFIDADGHITNFRATRYNTSTSSLETWETPIATYGTLSGLSLPTRGSAVWKLDTGDLDYIELDITALSYE